MKTKLKRILMLSKTGRKFWNYLRLKKGSFRSASIPPFQYLDKWWKKSAIDRIYESTFDNLFILIKSLGVKGDVFEFGTYQGYTALLFAKNIRKFELHDTSLYLFDSFEGFPEPKGIDDRSYEFLSNTWIKGSVSAPGGMEKVIHKRLSGLLTTKRVTITKGFFENTLEPFYAKSNKPKASVIHIDCDLYSSSKYVLDFVLKHEIVQDGTILIFDDWMTSRGNPNLGQRKAAKEVLDNYPSWSLEQYCNYGIGSHVFIAHDLRVIDARYPATPCENNVLQESLIAP